MPKTTIEYSTDAQPSDTRRTKSIVTVKQETEKVEKTDSFTLPGISVYRNYGDLQDSDCAGCSYISYTWGETLAEAILDLWNYETPVTSWNFNGASANKLAEVPVWITVTNERLGIDRIHVQQNYDSFCSRQAVPGIDFGSDNFDDVQLSVTTDLVDGTSRITRTCAYVLTGDGSSLGDVAAGEPLNCPTSSNTFIEYDFTDAIKVTFSNFKWNATLSTSVDYDDETGTITCYDGGNNAFECAVGDTMEGHGTLKAYSATVAAKVCGPTQPTAPAEVNNVVVFADYDYATDNSVDDPLQGDNPSALTASPSRETMGVTVQQATGSMWGCKDGEGGCDDESAAIQHAVRPFERVVITERLDMVLGSDWTPTYGGYRLVPLGELYAGRVLDNSNNPFVHWNSTRLQDGTNAYSQAGQSIAFYVESIAFRRTHFYQPSGDTWMEIAGVVGGGASIIITTWAFFAKTFVWSDERGGGDGGGGGVREEKGGVELGDGRSFQDNPMRSSEK